MRQTITIPAAGEELQIKITGRSVIIEFANLYPEPADVPLLGFNSGNDQFPIYPRSIYQCQSGEFQGIIITGTAESAGDTIKLISVKECLASDIKIEFSQSFESVPGTTFDVEANDVAQSLALAQLLDAEGNVPTKLLVSVSPTAGAGGGGIRWAITSTPVQGNDTLGNTLTQEMGTYEIVGIEWMLAFNFIAEINLEPVTVNFTPEY